MSHRIPLWLPYLKSIKRSRKGIFDFSYQGGEEHTELKNISTIMIYGDSDVKLEISVMEEIARNGIPIIIHRRNMSQPIVIHGGLRHETEDTLTAQIICRENTKKATHIVRQLLAAKFRSMQPVACSPSLPPHASINDMRTIESVHAKLYWRTFFDIIGHGEWTRRGEETGKNPASAALDAASRFLTGIILRWVTYHHLSPFHGFLHIPSDYNALIYDLIEPYRGIFDCELMRVFKDNPHRSDDWTAMSITTIKNKLEERTYVPLTRQIVTYHELLHGIVLSLKSYLLGRQRKFHVPLPGKPRGGRPPKIEFRMYGRNAGKTDFWDVAKKLSHGV